MEKNKETRYFLSGLFISRGNWANAEDIQNKSPRSTYYIRDPAGEVDGAVDDIGIWWV